MPKYFDYKVFGYYIYFTMHCLAEPTHIHISDSRLTEGGSAKIWLKEDGELDVANKGDLTDLELRKILRHLRTNIEVIKETWDRELRKVEDSGKGNKDNGLLDW